MSELLAVNRPRVDRYAGCNMYSTTRLLDWRVEKKAEVLWVLVGVPDDPSPRSPNLQDKIHLQLKGMSDTQQFEAFYSNVVESSAVWPVSGIEQCRTRRDKRKAQSSLRWIFGDNIGA